MVTKLEITPAPEVEAIGQRLVTEYHDHLDGVGLLYLFTTQELKDGKSPSAAKVQKLTPLQRFLLSGSTVEGEEWAIFVQRDAWAQLGKTERYALIDHELMHLALDEPDDEDKPSQIVLVGHDLQCFHAEIRRYGPWAENLRVAVKQLRLWEEEQQQQPARQPAGVV